MTAERKQLQNKPGPWPLGTWSAEQTLPGGMKLERFALFKRDDEFDHNNIVGYVYHERERNEVVTACNTHAALAARVATLVDRVDAADKLNDAILTENSSLRVALHDALAFVETFTGNGCQQQPLNRSAIKADGSFDAEVIAAFAQRVLGRKVRS